MNIHLRKFSNIAYEMGYNRDKLKNLVDQFIRITI